MNFGKIYAYYYPHFNAQYNSIKVENSTTSYQKKIHKLYLCIFSFFYNNGVYET